MIDRSKPEELWAFVDDGGLVAAAIGGLGVVALVTNKQRLLEMMEPIARQHAINHQKPVSLVRYQLAGVIRTFEADGRVEVP